MKEKSQELYRSYYSSPYGLWEIVCSDSALLSVNHVNDAAAQERTNELSKAVCEQLDEYFTGKRKSFDLPLMLEGTEFQKSVWEALCEIPYGETRSYSDIAERIGKPKACRAVGMANHNNPVAIIVPCHRVIGKNGTLTGYAGGLDTKAGLLQFEKSMR